MALLASSRNKRPMAGAPTPPSLPRGLSYSSAPVRGAGQGAESAGGRAEGRGLVGSPGAQPGWQSGRALLWQPGLGLSLLIPQASPGSGVLVKVSPQSCPQEEPACRWVGAGGAQLPAATRGRVLAAVLCSGASLGWHPAAARRGPHSPAEFPCWKLGGRAAVFPQLL